MEWLVAQGLDVNEPDTLGVYPLFAQAEASATYPETAENYPGKVRLLLSLGANVHQRSPSGIGGEFTALHIAAFRGAGSGVQTLLEFGAEADALDGEGLTALDRVVPRAKLGDEAGLAAVAGPLVAAGAKTTPEMREAIVHLGREIEAVRPGGDPYHAAKSAKAYASLARIFDVDATAHNRAADEIFVPRASVKAQHRVLWDALVPQAGPATSVQGEVIRVTGRIGHEVLEMGGINWDEDYRAMLIHLPELLALGVPLSDGSLERVRQAAERLSSGRHHQRSAREVGELERAAVEWVSLNRTPIQIAPPPYGR